MSQERLEAWFAGALKDEELADEEVLWLEHRVFDAVARKLTTAPASETLQ